MRRPFCDLDTRCERDRVPLNFWSAAILLAAGNDECVRNESRAEIVRPQSICWMIMHLREASGNTPTTDEFKDTFDAIVVEQAPGRLQSMNSARHGIRSTAIYPAIHVSCVVRPKGRGLTLSIRCRPDSVDRSDGLCPHG